MIPVIRHTVLRDHHHSVAADHRMMLCQLLDNVVAAVILTVIKAIISVCVLQCPHVDNKL